MLAVALVLVLVLVLYIVLLWYAWYGTCMVVPNTSSATVPGSSATVTLDLALLVLVLFPCDINKINITAV